MIVSGTHFSIFMRDSKVALEIEEPDFALLREDPDFYRFFIQEVAKHTSLAKKRIREIAYEDGYADALKHYGISQEQINSIAKQVDGESMQLMLFPLEEE